MDESRQRIEQNIKEYEQKLNDPDNLTLDDWPAIYRGLTRAIQGLRSMDASAELTNITDKAVYLRELCDLIMGDKKEGRLTENLEGSELDRIEQAADSLLDEIKNPETSRKIRQELRKRADCAYEAILSHKVPFEHWRRLRHKMEEFHTAQRYTSDKDSREDKLDDEFGMDDSPSRRVGSLRH